MAEEKKVKIRLPLTRETKGDVFIRVNRRTWLVKRGTTVELPECAVEVLENAEKMQEEAYDFEVKAQSKGSKA